MKRQPQFALGAALLALLAITAVTFAQEPMPASMTASRSNVDLEMRKLWEEHVMWTRLYIVSATADLPDKAATAQRLLRNQTDIGDAIKPFFGEAAGTKLSALLKDHILIAVDLIDAAKANDAAKQGEAGKRWSGNADDIAAFLSQANPKQWPADEMKMMMHEHLELTTTEVVARLRKDWVADIAAYDEAHEQILKMADMLSAGLHGQSEAKLK